MVHVNEVWCRPCPTNLHSPTQIVHTALLLLHFCLLHLAWHLLIFLDLVPLDCKVHKELTSRTSPGSISPRHVGTSNHAMYILSQKTAAYDAPLYDRTRVSHFAPPPHCQNRSNCVTSVLPTMRWLSFPKTLAFDTHVYDRVLFVPPPFSSPPLSLDLVRALGLLFLLARRLALPPVTCLPQGFNLPWSFAPPPRPDVVCRERADWIRIVPPGLVLRLPSEGFTEVFGAGLRELLSLPTLRASNRWCRQMALRNLQQVGQYVANSPSRISPKAPPCNRRKRGQDR